MTKPSSNLFILGIILPNMALDGVICVVIAAFGYWQGWFSPPIHYSWFGNAFLLAGLSLLVLSGFSFLVRRTALAGQDPYPETSAFSDLNAIGVDRYPGAIPVVSANEGKASFWQTYAASLSLALSAFDAIVLGVVLRFV